MKNSQTTQAEKLKEETHLRDLEGNGDNIKIIFRQDNVMVRNKLSWLSIVYV